MITEEDLAKTNIALRYDISPVKNIIADLSGLIGNFCDELIGSFYPKIISKKANIVITELLDNAVENVRDAESNITLEIKINKDELCIKVINVADREQYENVRAHLSLINSSKDPRQLLADTIRQRRKDRKKGGLGLIRLVVENKFSIDVDYDNSFLIVESQIPLGGLR
jgi:hypothetical protein